MDSPMMDPVVQAMLANLSSILTATRQNLTTCLAQHHNPVRKVANPMNKALLAFMIIFIILTVMLSLFLGSSREMHIREFYELPAEKIHEELERQYKQKMKGYFRNQNPGGESLAKKTGWVPGTRFLSTTIEADASGFQRRKIVIIEDPDVAKEIKLVASKSNLLLSPKAGNPAQDRDIERGEVIRDPVVEAENQRMMELERVELARREVQRRETERARERAVINRRVDEEVERRTLIEERLQVLRDGNNGDIRDGMLPAYAP